MKIVQIETLISTGLYSKSDEWVQVRQSAHDAVVACEWPPGAGSFTIYPESGKKRGEGNGVKPIKNAAIERLIQESVLGKKWIIEQPWSVGMIRGLTSCQAHGNRSARTITNGM